MILDIPGMEFEIVSSAKAKLLRETFIKKFVDTTSNHYQKYIETMRQDGDDLFYDGYLWDCLQCNEDYQKECSMETAAEFLRAKKNVFMNGIANRPHTLWIVIVRVCGFHRIYTALMKAWNGMLSSLMRGGKRAGKDRTAQN